MINNLATLSRHVAHQDQQAATTRRRTGFQTCAIRSRSNPAQISANSWTRMARACLSGRPASSPVRRARRSTPSSRAARRGGSERVANCLRARSTRCG
jgi:hypothetical protein